jgi:hypothetical protein
MCAHNHKHLGVGVTCVTHLTTPPLFIMKHVSVLVTNLFGNHSHNVLQTTTQMSSQVQFQVLLHPDGNMQLNQQLMSKYHIQ